VVEQLSGALKEINTSGIAILLVEQDVMTAFELANRGFVFESEKVILRGPTMELADDPTVRKAYMVI
jgi:branched-chain amino acid transport system ATP-binding protein